jgi:Ni,Fe-hydrogenase I cytochrome b subunit
MGYIALLHFQLGFVITHLLQWTIFLLTNVKTKIMLFTHR